MCVTPFGAGCCGLKTRRVGLDIDNARRDSEKDFCLAHRLLGQIRNKRMELRHDAGGNESRDRHHRRGKPFSVEMIHNAEKSCPETLFHEIIMIRNNLRVLEQNLSANDSSSPRLRRAKQTERSGQVRPATIHHSLLRVAHHVQHPVQK